MTLRVKAYNLRVQVKSFLTNIYYITLNISLQYNGKYVEPNLSSVPCYTIIHICNLSLMLRMKKEKKDYMSV